MPTPDKYLSLFEKGLIRHATIGVGGILSPPVGSKKRFLVLDGLVNHITGTNTSVTFQKRQGQMSLMFMAFVNADYANETIRLWEMVGKLGAAPSEVSYALGWRPTIITEEYAMMIEGDAGATMRIVYLEYDEA